MARHRGITLLNGRDWVVETTRGLLLIRGTEDSDIIREVSFVLVSWTVCHSHSYKVSRP